MLSNAVRLFTTVARLTLLMMLFALSGCAALSMGNPEAPTISIESVTPRTLAGNLQRLEMELLIQNPNKFDLQIDGLDFTAFVNGDRFATGESDQSVNVPALSEALLEVQLVLGLADLFSQAAKLITNPEDGPLKYGISGTVDLNNWPTAIPFNVDGEYSNPIQ